jgi:pimeloyl-ACP methyl ester carboxylesterase
MLNVVLEPFKMPTSRLTLAGLKNDKREGQPIIALHGWLDNAASFIPLYEQMPHDRPFYALEMPGHGLSEHRPSSTSYHLLENIIDVLAFMDEVAPEQTVSLIGHSLGGIVGSLLAAASPERFDKLVLLDSLGPFTDETSNVLPQLRKAIAKASLFKSSKMTVYPSKEMACSIRMKGVGKVDRPAATLLVERGIKEVEGGYSWTSDPKLLEPSFMRFTEAQVKTVFSGIECPIRLICGDKGYFSNYEDLKKRFEYLQREDEVLDRHVVSGGHHFHMDGDVVTTAELIHEFMYA